MKLPLDIALKPGKHLPGERYGKLTTVRIIGSSKRWGHIWLLRCDCGEYATKILAQIGADRPSNRQCAECAQKSRKKKSDSHIHYLETLDGGLYSPAWEATEIEALRSEMGLYKEDAGSTGVVETDSAPGRFEQRISSLYPIRSLDESAQWKCCHCDQPFSAVLGCVECLATVCPSCVREDKHKHASDDESTLEEIGQEIGITREGVRLIVLRASAKLKLAFAPLKKPFAKPSESVKAREAAKAAKNVSWAKVRVRLIRLRRKREQEELDSSTASARKVALWMAKNRR